MKQLFLGLVATLLATVAWSQTVTLQFAGANKNREFQVVLNVTTYYSANATGTGNNRRLTLNNLPTGTHSISVYPAGTTTNVNNALYNNTFQLRQGYDMNIIVR